MSRRVHSKEVKMAAMKRLEERGVTIEAIAEIVRECRPTIIHPLHLKHASKV